MSLKMEKLASASPSTAARLRDLERLDRRESNSSVPVSNRNGSITGIAYPVSNRRRASMFDPIDPTELQKTLYQTKVNVITTTSLIIHIYNSSLFQLRVYSFYPNFKSFLQ